MEPIYLRYCPIMGLTGPARWHPAGLHETPKVTRRGDVADVGRHGVQRAGPGPARGRDVHRCPPEYG